MLIKKRADQLVPGDIVVSQLPRMPGPDLGGPPFITVRRVVLRKEGKDTGNDGFITAPLDSTRGAVRTDLQFFQPHAMLDVEVPDLTPAQAHAEELVDLVREVAEHATAFLAVKARALLDRIDPPKPPTLDEVLAALDDLRGEVEMNSASTRDADAILERARRSGLLPNG